MFFQIVLCHWSTRHTTDSWHLGRWSNDTKWYVSIGAFTWILRDIQRYQHNTSNQFIWHTNKISQRRRGFLNSYSCHNGRPILLIINKVNFEAILPLMGAGPPAAHLNLKELDWNKAEVSRWPASLQSTPHSTWTAAESVKRRGILCQRILNESWKTKRKRIPGAKCLTIFCLAMASLLHSLCNWGVKSEMCIAVVAQFTRVNFRIISHHSD